MKTVERTYATLKLFRGKRKNVELERLSEEEKDFDYRRLLIEENEKDLHVFFSRKKVFEIVGVILFACSLIAIKLSILSKVLLILATIALVVSLYNRRKYKKTVEKLQFCLMLVDHVIEQTYGFSLPKYL
jgi:hypothetical protein